MQICWNKNKRVQLPFRICLEHQHGRLDFMWKRPADVGLLILSTTTEVQLHKSPGGTHVYGKRQTADSSWNSRFVENVNTRQHLQYSLLNSTPEKIANIWRTERVEISVIKFEAVRLHFLIDVFVAVVVVVA